MSVKRTIRYELWEIDMPDSPHVTRLKRKIRHHSYMLNVCRGRRDFDQCRYHENFRDATKRELEEYLNSNEQLRLKL
jgi:hypothetical protein